MQAQKETHSSMFQYLLALTQSHHYTQLYLLAIHNIKSVTISALKNKETYFI